jgi:hypothetical protein
MGVYYKEIILEAECRMDLRTEWKTELSRGVGSRLGVR